MTTQRKINQLKALCDLYSDHLSIELGEHGFDLQGTYLVNERRGKRLLVHKHQEIRLLKDILDDTRDSDDIKLTKFEERFLRHSKGVIEKSRSTAGILFLKGVLTALSLGLASIFGIWKTTGDKMIEKVDDVLELHKTRF